MSLMSENFLAVSKTTVVVYLRFPFVNSPHNVYSRSNPCTGFDGPFLLQRANSPKRLVMLELRRWRETSSRVQTSQTRWPLRRRLTWKPSFTRSAVVQPTIQRLSRLTQFRIWTITEFLLSFLRSFSFFAFAVGGGLPEALLASSVFVTRL